VTDDDKTFVLNQRIWQNDKKARKSQKNDNVVNIYMRTVTRGVDIFQEFLAFSGVFETSKISKNFRNIPEFLGISGTIT
jgi:hypothetical protein